MTCEAPPDFPKSNIDMEKIPKLQLRDLRQRLADVSLPNNGFTLVDLKSRLSYTEFGDEEKVKTIFLAEASEKLKAVFGATRVQIFEHLVCHTHANSNAHT